MILEADVNWISEKFFSEANPCPCEVVDIDMAEVKGKADLRIEVRRAADLGTWMLSVWGDNKKACMRHWGADTDAWIGKKCKISLTNVNGAKHKIITPL